MAIRVSNRQFQSRVTHTTLIVTCFEREADAGPAGTSIDDRSFVRVARGAVVLIEGRARRVDDSKNELARMPIEDLRPADRKRRFRCSPRWRPADVSMWVYARAFFSDTSFTTAARDFLVHRPVVECEGGVDGVVSLVVGPHPVSACTGAVADRDRAAALQGLHVRREGRDLRIAGGGQLELARHRTALIRPADGVAP